MYNIFYYFVLLVTKAHDIFNTYIINYKIIFTSYGPILYYLINGY